MLSREFRSGKPSEGFAPISDKRPLALLLAAQVLHEKGRCHSQGIAFRAARLPRAASRLLRSRPRVVRRVSRPGPWLGIRRSRTFVSDHIRLTSSIWLDPLVHLHRRCRRNWSGLCADTVDVDIFTKNRCVSSVDCVLVEPQQLGLHRSLFRRNVRHKGPALRMKTLVSCFQSSLFADTCSLNNPMFSRILPRHEIPLMVHLV